MAKRPPFDPPRPEPEIIPPDPQRARRRDRAGVWTAQQRVVFVPPGPLAWLLGILILGALTAVGFLIFLGLFFVVLPALGVLALVALLAALLRGPPRRL
jgi:hypothetical protein